jgi:hypothetical protein
MSTRLTLLQQRFVNEFVSGEHAGNGEHAYCRANPRVKNGNVARASASRLLTNVNVLKAIQAAHAQANAAMIRRLKDWKLLAIACQDTIISLAQGEMPTYTVPTEHGVIVKKDTAVGRIQFEAARYICEKAFPQPLRLSWDDPKQGLADVLGVPVAELP